MIPLKKRRIQRRTLLRCAAGGLGTAIALPPLEAMFGSDRAYAAGVQGVPRFVAIYQPNGHHNSPFHPVVNGDIRNLDFAGKNSSPLEPWLKSGRATILRNLVGPQAGYDDGIDQAAKSSGNDHLVAIVSWLTGKPVATAKDNSHSVSMVAFLADRYEELHPTGRSQHVVISGSPFVDPGRMDYNNEQKDWVSTDRNGKNGPRPRFRATGRPNVRTTWPTRTSTSTGAIPPRYSRSRCAARRFARWPTCWRRKRESLAMRTPGSATATLCRTTSTPTTASVINCTPSCFSEMLGVLDQQIIGDGTLLDSTLVLWGAGIGQVHSADQQMAVIAGYTGGNIKHGALRDFRNQTSSVLLPRTLLSHLGVLQDGEKFGLAKPGQELDLTS